METLESFLSNDYPAGVQIILAYNTPKDMPIEATFKEMAKRHPNFLPLRVMGSTSKAQNVNAAVIRCTGKFVGVFDADHKPDPGSFQRAWRWLSNGYDIVQGHCLIRNGDESWVARMIAVEFESIYSASHPGRARFHGFGLFGGSNGYWRTNLLRLTRMHHFMLTEDIDSTLRVVISGHKVGNDPYLISRELAPTTLKQLRNQRLRWAQGWLQVSVKWIVPALRSPHLTFRQKLGMFHLLVWRELFPWFSIQVVPILCFWIYDWGFENINWLVPIFVATTLYTAATGPGTVWFTYKLADPSIKRHKGWFGRYLYESFFFYTPFKNLLSRWSHVKEMMRERVWRVTPRTVRSHTEPLKKDDPAPAESEVERPEAPRGDDHGQFR
jgi:cellulose synthase/poly-beta-1,6-N-acetylglucosamine synthase-like glycosyltransferase